jgi:hypothetical protein
MSSAICPVTELRHTVDVAHNLSALRRDAIALSENKLRTGRTRLEAGRILRDESTGESTVLSGLSAMTDLGNSGGGHGEASVKREHKITKAPNGYPVDENSKGKAFENVKVTKVVYEDLLESIRARFLLSGKTEEEFTHEVLPHFIKTKSSYFIALNPPEQSYVAETSHPWFHLDFPKCKDKYCTLWEHDNIVTRGGRVERAKFEDVHKPGTVTWKKENGEIEVIPGHDLAKHVNGETEGLHPMNPAAVEKWITLQAEKEGTLFIKLEAGQEGTVLNEERSDKEPLAVVDTWKEKNVREVCTKLQASLAWGTLQKKSLQLDGQEYSRVMDTFVSPTRDEHLSTKKYNAYHNIVQAVRKGWSPDLVSKALGHSNVSALCLLNLEQQRLRPEVVLEQTRYETATERTEFVGSARPTWAHQKINNVPSGTLKVRPRERTTNMHTPERVHLEYPSTKRQPLYNRVGRYYSTGLTEADIEREIRLVNKHGRELRFTDEVAVARALPQKDLYNFSYRPDYVRTYEEESNRPTFLRSKYEQCGLTPEEEFRWRFGTSLLASGKQSLFMPFSRVNMWLEDKVRSTMEKVRETSSWGDGWALGYRKYKLEFTKRKDRRSEEHYTDCYKPNGTKTLERRCMFPSRCFRSLAVLGNPTFLVIRKEEATGFLRKDQVKKAVPAKGLPQFDNRTNKTLGVVRESLHSENVGVKIGTNVGDLPVREAKRVFHIRQNRGETRWLPFNPKKVTFYGEGIYRTTVPFVPFPNEGQWRKGDVLPNERNPYALPIVETLAKETKKEVNIGILHSLESTILSPQIKRFGESFAWDINNLTTKFPLRIKKGDWVVRTKGGKQATISENGRIRDDKHRKKGIIVKRLNWTAARTHCNLAYRDFKTKAFKSKDWRVWEKNITRAHDWYFLAMICELAGGTTAPGFKIEPKNPRDTFGSSGMVSYQTEGSLDRFMTNYTNEETGDDYEDAANGSLYDPFFAKGSTLESPQEVFEDEPLSDVGTPAPEEYEQGYFDAPKPSTANGEERLAVAEEEEQEEAD